MPFYEIKSFLTKSEVCHQYDGPGSIYQRHHEDGWHISGEVVQYGEDLIVEEFRAEHPDFGLVTGSFRDGFESDSDDGLHDFFMNHEIHTIFKKVD